MLKAMLDKAKEEHKGAQLVLSVKLVSGEWLERRVLDYDDGWVAVAPQGNDLNEPAKLYINDRHVVKAWVAPAKVEPVAEEDP
jgi:hypothetical protein